MDPRHVPVLPHPAVGAISREARALFASGWFADRDEGWLVLPADFTRRLVSPEIWRGVRELATLMRPKLVPQVH